MKNLIKKSVVVGMNLLLMFNFVNGSKKKNINKYIFMGGKWLVVFDGETKTVQRKKLLKNIGEDTYYFPKSRRLSIGLTSFDVNNLNSYFTADILKLKRTDKLKYFLSRGLIKSKNNNNSLSFRFTEADITDEEAIQRGVKRPSRIKDNIHNRFYSWNVANNTFKEVFTWDVIYDTDDPYRLDDDFILNPLTDKTINNFKEAYEIGLEMKKKTSDISYGFKQQRRRFLRYGKSWRMGKKLKKILKNGKINVGNYNNSSDLKYIATGGRYVVILNDKLYLVQMKTKEVHTLIPEPQNLNYFIIEKNEDDLDLDKE